VKFLIPHKNLITSVRHKNHQEHLHWLYKNCVASWLFHYNKYTKNIFDLMQYKWSQLKFTRVEFPLTFKGKFLMIITWCAVHWSLTWVHRYLILGKYQFVIHLHRIGSELTSLWVGHSCIYGQHHVSKVYKSLSPALTLFGWNYSNIFKIHKSIEIFLWIALT